MSLKYDPATARLTFYESNHNSLQNLAVGDVHTQYALHTTLRSGEITAVKTSAYTITTSDEIIRIDSSGGAFNLTLPDPALRWSGYIQDTVGSLSTNQVTLVRNASEKINGLAASRLIYADFGIYKVWSDGTDHWVS